MTTPTNGFAFMRAPAALSKAYDASPVALATAMELAQLRAALPDVHGDGYRGIGRYPLNADYDYQDPGWQWEKRSPSMQEGLATLAVEEALGLRKGVWREDEWLIDGPWLLPGLAAALHVRSFLEDQSAYEMIEVACYPSRTTAPAVGFDVGWWASGNFSIVCDAVVWPLWHPPPVEAMPAMAEYLQGLNEAVLFADVASAERYREWYRQQKWAEHEGRPFEIIEVAVVDLDAAVVRRASPGVPR